MVEISFSWYDRGLYAGAEAVQIRVLDGARERLGHRHPDTLMAMGQLGSTRFEQGRYTNSEQLLGQVCSNRKASLGGAHVDTLSDKPRLADSWRIRGSYNDAESAQSTVVNMQKRILGELYPDTFGRCTSVYHSIERDPGQLERRTGTPRLGEDYHSATPLQRRSNRRRPLIGQILFC